jgi:hypothetical protein
MATTDDQDRGRRQGRSLRHVQAATLRARAVRGALGKTALGTLFLLGALSYGLGPAPHDRSSLLWMAGLVVLSTFNVGLGLRTLSRVRHRGGRLWLPAALAWGVLSVVMLKLLSAGR